MKPKQPFLCLLLSASAMSVLPVVSQDVVKPVAKTEAQIAQEKQHACHIAIESKILRHLNPEVSLADRFSRVKQPMPAQYYAAKITGENAEGMIEFQITHVNLMISKPADVVVATGIYNSKTAELLLKNDQSGVFVSAAEHPLLKKKSST